MSIKRFFQLLYATFCAGTATAAAGELEAMGRAGNLCGALAAYESLESAMQLLNPELAKLSNIISRRPAYSRHLPAVPGRGNGETTQVMG
jgi:hypothetical protein